MHGMDIVHGHLETVRLPSISHTLHTQFTITSRLRQTSWSTNAVLLSLPASATRPCSLTPQAGQRKIGPASTDSLATTLQKSCIAPHSPPRPMICTPLGSWHGRYGWTPLYSTIQFAYSIQVLTGRPPFFEMTEIAATYSMLSGARPPRPNHHEVSDRIWSMVERCWHTVPSRRMSIEEVVGLLEAELRRGFDSGT